MQLKIPKTPILSTDGILLERGKILMVKRDIKPFCGYWTLPGGKVEYGERVEEAIKREMKEELGVSVRIKKLIGVYSDPKREPRYHSVSVAYFLERGKGKIKLNFEASGFKYFSLNKLPSRIGFDHRQIINDLRKLLK